MSNQNTTRRSFLRNLFAYMIIPPIAGVAVREGFDHFEKAVPQVPQPPQVPQIDQDPTNVAPARPLDIAGYHEMREAMDSAYPYISDDQQHYIHDKAELQAALEGGAAVDANIQAFAHMIERVKLLPDPIEQIEAVNGWVNLAITYDDNEAQTDTSADQHRSLCQALTDGAAVCDEQARLKLFALEAVGFDEDDVRWLAVDLFKKNRRETEGHAVTIARVGDNVWVLNNQQYHLDGNELAIGYEDAANLMINDAAIEAASTALNIAGNSTINSDTLIPSYSFNSTERAFYDSNIHDSLDNTHITDEVKQAGAVLAQPSIPHSKSGLRKSRVGRILRPALEAHMQIAEITDEPSNDMPDYPYGSGGTTSNPAPVFN